jgi:hypothetical protein
LGEWKEFDLYFCPQHGVPTVIARYGPDGDYQSGLPAADAIPALGEAKRRAIAAGLLPAVPGGNPRQGDV